ncbi:Mitochondrial inner membrane protease subunit 2 [Triticum urartu]|uniref:Mitochondrial inner membrane protease subunit 2 n=1 Tax=Triticum urartu TaxID=4572 RepID=M7Z291_TRIUA|nr:Mitochondrial inner membrane protease subunit 2 [Triticum urartu]
MHPTFEGRTGEYALVERLCLERYDFSRGDVVTFVTPVDHQRKAIKRVIGLPGDWISVPETEEIRKIPEGHCWLEGDNGSVSQDSRAYGPTSVRADWSGAGEGDTRGVAAPQDRPRRQKGDSSCNNVTSAAGGGHLLLRLRPSVGTAIESLSSVTFTGCRNWAFDNKINDLKVLAEGSTKRNPDQLNLMNSRTSCYPNERPQRNQDVEANRSPLMKQTPGTNGSRMITHTPVGNGRPQINQTPVTDGRPPLDQTPGINRRPQMEQMPATKS